MQIRILIVDDEKEISELLQHYLTLEGYEVNTANSSKEALALIESEDYSIVITDIMMPEMNGLDLIKRVKTHNGLIQIIVITGYITIENVLTAFRWGASNCFFKPFENLALIKKEVELAVAKLERIREVLHKLGSVK